EDDVHVLADLIGRHEVRDEEPRQLAVHAVLDDAVGVIRPSDPRLADILQATAERPSLIEPIGRPEICTEVRRERQFVAIRPDARNCTRRSIRKTVVSKTGLALRQILRGAQPALAVEKQQAAEHLPAIGNIARDAKLDALHDLIAVTEEIVARRDRHALLGTENRGCGLQASAEIVLLDADFMVDAANRVRSRYKAGKCRRIAFA